MFGLTSPTLTDQRMQPAYWTAKRAAAMTAVYPDGVLTAQPDVVEPNWTGETCPSEASSITRLTVTNPGGRSGGSVIYAHVFHPRATSSGRCIPFLCGHMGLFSSYLSDDGSSIVRRGLANGDTVAAFDMPNYGSQPAQEVVANGQLHVSDAKNNEHFPGNVTPAVSPPYDDPQSYMRLFTDHPIIAMNWVESELGIHKFALVGHSGGGSTAIFLSAVEPRFDLVHILQGAFYRPPALTAITCWVGYSASDIALACQHIPYTGGRDVLNVGASHSGRLTVFHSATHDEYADNPTDVSGAYQVAKWKDHLLNVNAWITSATGGLSSIAFHEKDTGTHNVDSPQAKWVTDHIRDNL